MKPTIVLPHIFRFLFVFAFYAGVGGSLLVDSLVVKLLVTLITCGMAGPFNIPWLLPLVASISGIAFGGAEYGCLRACVVWFSVTTIVLSSIQIYERLLGGVEYASLARFVSIRHRNTFATTGYYIFKVLPELQSRLHRIIIGMKVYGVRNHVSKKNNRLVLLTNLFFETLSIYLFQALEILLSLERVMDRRSMAAGASIQGSRAIGGVTLFCTIFVPVITIVGAFLKLP